MSKSLRIRTSDLCLVLPAIHLFIPCHLPVLDIAVGARTQGLGPVPALELWVITSQGQGRGCLDKGPLCALLAPNSLWGWFCP